MAPSPTAQAQKEAVDRVVAAHNARNGRDEAAFTAAGWKMVVQTPPDLRLTSYDPSLIGQGRESELRTQLASTIPRPADVHRVAMVARLAAEPVTRESAVDALSRVRTAEAQDELIDLLTGGKLAPDDLGRRQLAASISPSDLEDEVAARMAGLLDNDTLLPRERKQLAFTLALVGLRDGMTLPDRVTETMSPQAMALVTEMTALAKRNLIAHTHAPDHG